MKRVASWLPELDLLSSPRLSHRHPMTTKKLVRPTSDCLWIVFFNSKKNSLNDLLSVDCTIHFSSLVHIFNVIFKLLLLSLFHKKFVLFFFNIYLLIVVTMPPAQPHRLDWSWEGTHGRRTSWPTFLHGDDVDASRFCYGDIYCFSVLCLLSLSCGIKRAILLLFVFI